MNNNTLLPKHLLNVVAQSLLQHWSSEQHKRQAGEIDVAKPSPPIEDLLSRLLQHKSTVHTPGSQIDSFSTPPLQRSASLSSSASLSRSASLSSTASTICGDDQEEDDVDVDCDSGRRRARAPEVERLAVAVVRRHVLGLVDSKFLALHPQVENDLFKRRFKRHRNGDGTRCLKKHKDIVMPVFRGIVRNVIRRLCRRDLPTLQRNDETLTYARLRRRYFRAALKVVKKRRANHIQSWRLQNTHRPLIYDNDLEQQQRIQHPESPGPRPASAPVQPVVSNKCERLEAQPAAVESQPSDPSTPTKPAVESEVSDPRPPSAPVKPAVRSLPAKRKISEVDFSEENDEEFKCCEKNCGVVLTKDTAFPKNKKNKWGKTKFRCAQHYDQHVVTMCKIVEDVRARERALRALGSKRTNASKKKSNRVGCKWCGLTTHKTKRSRKCPCNPRNIKSQQQPEPESQRQSEPEQESQRQSEPEQESQQQSEPAPVPEPHDLDKTETEPEPAPLPVPEPHDSDETETEPEPEPADDQLPPLYGVGDNVLAQYSGRWYLAHVSKLLGNGLINVYFPSDAKTKDVRPHEVRPYQGVQQPTRADMLNKTFDFEGDNELPPGVWKVRQLKHDNNEYVCTKIRGSGVVNVDKFDVGYVMNRVREQEERIRQS